MKRNLIKTILCPVDLSDNSLLAIELATEIAKAHGAKLELFYVAPPKNPEQIMTASDSSRDILDDDKKSFLNTWPADPGIDCLHTYIHGIPGLEIVKASRTRDLIVMSTHGHSGISRFLMGSVSQYVLRNATCPVILFKNRNVDAEPPMDDLSDRLVLDVMQRACPVRRLDRLDGLITEHDEVNLTAAPVVDVTGVCIGILTKSDVDHYQQLRQRHREQDKSVLDEMFEVDKFGLRRSCNYDFDLVCRHMTSPAITIGKDETIEIAEQLFSQHPTIHHLVVVDEWNHPIGIVEASKLNVSHTPPREVEANR